MAQANVAREPSMDEILASIRRIIESNDPIPANGLPLGGQETGGFAGEPANDDAEDDDVELTVDEELKAREMEIELRRAAFAKARPGEAYVPAGPESVNRTPDAEPRRGLEAAEARTERAPEANPVKPLSLADVAARVRAASERQTVAQAETAPAQGQGRADNPLMPGRLAQTGQPSVAAVAGRIEPELDVPVLAEDDADDVGMDMDAAAIEHLSVEAGRDASAFEALAPFLDDRAKPAQAIATTDTQLVSAPVGEQVARSFTELAVAVEMSERRSFDEIAAELLRPMLQEWLDDNLPSLVERLVREEIERVARGPRR